MAYWHYNSPHSLEHEDWATSKQTYTFDIICPFSPGVNEFLSKYKEKVRYNAYYTMAQWEIKKSLI